MRRLYFDHAASTPVDPRVLRAMRPYFSREFGNPGSLHSFGQKAIAAVDTARESLGKFIGVKHFREIIFTSGATEANNLALCGAVEFYKKHHPANEGVDVSARPRIIISSIEHESIFETAQVLEQYGVEVVRLPVNKEGIVDIIALKDALNDDTVIVSVMHVNNETGTIQPLREIRFMIDEFRKSVPHGDDPYPLFHTDAAQSFPYLYCDVGLLGVDMMTLSAHKMHGPKGVGALYVRRDEKNFSASGGFPLIAQATGGGQEFGMRSGTENVPGIVGFAKAAELAAAARGKTSTRVAALRDEFWRRIKLAAPTAEINGPAGDAKAPHILNIHFPGHAAQDLLTRFDRAGLAASSGSACRSRAVESSYVIEALGYSKERAGSSIRFSLGRETTKREIAAAAKIVEKALL
ncbi:MAG: cysteine desulfurase family protein [Minisyncoccia bacterium]